MSAIDAITSKYDDTSLLAATANSTKKNVNIDFNQLLVAAMMPGLPGVESGQSSQEMLQVSMIQQMQALASKIDSLATAISNKNNTDTDTDTASTTQGV